MIVYPLNIEWIDKSRNLKVNRSADAIVFKLLLYGDLSSSQLSLNVLISLFDKIGFRSNIGVDKGFSVKHSPLANSLVSLDSDFFKDLLKSPSSFSLNICPLIKSKAIRFICLILPLWPVVPSC